MSPDATVFGALLEALARAGEYNSADQTAPAAILWTDPERQWEPLAPRLREALPWLLTLGEYDPATRTGPAIWLRCMIERALPEADWPEATIPVLYMPGVSRQELRPTEGMPWALQPLVELQYRGVAWTQYNGKDWTVAAFLVTARGGLGLDVAADTATQEAMLRALQPLADTLVRDLRGKRLEATDFDALLHPDVIRDVLRWLDDPAGTRAQWDDNYWGSFRSSCQDKLGFDPQGEGELGAAERLGRREGVWSAAWERFAESPENYPHLPGLLRRARPEKTDSLFFDESTWPQANEQAEARLREALSALAGKAAPEGREAVRNLERDHGERRGWVWARLGQAPLAEALKPLNALADLTQTALGGATPEDIASHYAAGLWKADDAALEALGTVSTAADRAAVEAAVRTVYLPWLAAGAEHFQEAVRQQPLPCQPAEETAAELGHCLLFADGLRFDVGQRVREALERSGCSVTGDWSFTALPPVTATAKPAVSPIAPLVGKQGGVNFEPLFGDGTGLTTDRIIRRMEERGWVSLGKDDTGSPEGTAWTECGRLDKRGHDEGVGLARRIGEEVEGLAQRVEQLLAAGWREVRIVTDHGWLLMPGGLPKVEMPAYLVESRWGRCAALKSTSQVSMQSVPWHWNPEVQVAMAPGVGCFIAGKEYAHGGLSVQECVVPVLTVTAAHALREVRIESVKWVGLRCRVQVRGGAGLRLDLRTKAGEADSSVLEDKPIAGETGEVSALVADDSLAGTAVNVVLVDDAGTQHAKASTTVGG